MLPFKPAQNAEPARWLEERLVDFGKNVLSVVPRGFEAYARVFHPAYQVTHGTRTPLRWSDVAAQSGRTCHREMQWPNILGKEPEHDHRKLGDTWIEGPEEGDLPVEVARVLWPILSQHTTTPERCFFAVWEGFGCFPESISEAPTFEIPARRFYLFRAPIEHIEKTFCTDNPDNTIVVTIVTRSGSSEKPTPAEIKDALKDLPTPKFPLHHQSANLWWPEDRAWCVATEIDFVTTYVAGSKEAIAAILSSEALEAYQVEPTDEITYLSDKINPRPAGS